MPTVYKRRGLEASHQKYTQYNIQCMNTIYTHTYSACIHKYSISVFYALFKGSENLMKALDNGDPTNIFGDKVSHNRVLLFIYKSIDNIYLQGCPEVYDKKSMVTKFSLLF